MPAINFKFPLDIGSLGHFATNDNTQDAVRENVKLTILTTAGERIINPVGSSYAFDVFSQGKEQIDNLITTHTKQLFKTYFPFLNIDSIIIKHPDDDPTVQDEQVVVTIHYSFKGVQSFNDSITIGL